MNSQRSSASGLTTLFLFHLTFKAEAETHKTPVECQSSKKGLMFLNLVVPGEQFAQTVVSHFIRSWTRFDNPCPHCTV